MLKELDLRCTKVTDAGCAALAAALDGGVQLPALERLSVDGGIHGRRPSPAARAAVQEALAKSRSMSSWSALLESLPSMSSLRRFRTQ